MHIIYYGRDGQKAEALAAEARASKRPAQVRDAQFFDQREKADEVTILDCVSDYDRARIAMAYEITADVTAVFEPPPPAKVSEPEWGNLIPTDEQLRAFIKEATGKAPHPKTGREKLVAQAKAIKAAAE